MTKLKLLALASVIAAGTVQAESACNGFQIKVNNHLADDLIVTKIKLHGAELAPGGIQKIKGNTEQVFTVNNSQKNVDMNGELTFHTISLPSKKVKVAFDLKNNGVVCEHSDSSPNSDYQVEKTRLPGKVSYDIKNS